LHHKAIATATAVCLSHLITLKNNNWQINAYKALYMTDNNAPTHAEQPYCLCPGTNVHSALTIARICFSEYEEPSTMTGRPMSSENRMWGLDGNCQTKCSRPNPAATQNTTYT